MKNINMNGLLFMLAVFALSISTSSQPPPPPEGLQKDSLIQWLRERNLQVLYHIEEKTLLYEKDPIVTAKE